MAYETDFNMIPDIDIPIFVTFLKRQYAEINDSYSVNIFEYQAYVLLQMLFTRGACYYFIWYMNVISVSHDI